MFFVSLHNYDLLSVDLFHVIQLKYIEGCDCTKNE